MEDPTVSLSQYQSLVKVISGHTETIRALMQERDEALKKLAHLITMLQNVRPFLYWENEYTFAPVEFSLFVNQVEHILDAAE